MEQARSIKQQINLSDFSELELSGAKDVLGFDEGQIEISLSDSLLFIGGKNLKIKSFSRETGIISVSGSIESIVREIKGQKTARGFLSRFFA